MDDGKLLVTIVAAIALIAVLSPWVFSALKESGRIKRPKFGGKSRSSVRQFPLHPPVQGDTVEFE